MYYRSDLIRYVRKIVGDIPEVEDIVHDSLLTAIEKDRQLLDRQKYRHWLFRIARNKAIDHAKCSPKAAGSLVIPEAYAEDVDTDPAILALADHHRELYQEIADLYLQQQKTPGEIRQILMDAYPEVAILPEAYLEALLLSEFDQLSRQDMAEHLNLPLPTAKSRIQRARQKVKEVFLKRCYFEFDRMGRIADFSCDK